MGFFEKPSLRTVRTRLSSRVRRVFSGAKFRIGTYYVWTHNSAPTIPIGRGRGRRRKILVTVLGVANLELMRGLEMRCQASVRLAFRGTLKPL